MKRYSIKNGYTGLAIKGAKFGLFGSMVVPFGSLPDNVRIFYFSENSEGFGINHAKKLGSFEHNGKKYDYYESYGAGGLKNAVKILDGKNIQPDCHILAD